MNNGQNSSYYGGYGQPFYYRLSPKPIHNPVYASDEFRMYGYKIQKCGRAIPHDWTDCPFVHCGEKARRRDPRKVPYYSVPCPHFQNGNCQRGDLCEFAHGIFECWLHPSRYRTQLCNAGEYCRRKVCFFAHTAEELRVETRHPCRNCTCGATMTHYSVQPYSSNNNSNDISYSNITNNITNNDDNTFNSNYMMWTGVTGGGDRVAYGQVPQMITPQPVLTSSPSMVRSGSGGERMDEMLWRFGRLRVREESEVGQSSGAGNGILSGGNGIVGDGRRGSPDFKWVSDLLK